ncbi:hypothetical protein C3K47_07030 [Solitalea longa]|uniref:Urease accessory protein UreH-like transmembrane domain-containing protein n=1 Tax=Solitalea longa TaxID=2079460 RepID=A0A2S5A4J1_9SPHI|nr:sulfite exporter TauE/SafE family protein [Solitalea longa]POY37511.1 hypothetical protein C3K47_07030 [Solitalea longa]
MIEALIFGFVGSFHCIGMCGPIALSLPVKNDLLINRVVSVLIYNLGRVISYSLIGLLFGLLGLGFKLAGFQQSLSIALGILILMIAIFPYFSKFRLNTSYILFKPIGLIKNAIAKLFSKPQLSSLFSIGLLNGLLPCGFVYLGIIWTTSLGSAYQGALFMVFFGLGTIPAMLGVGLMGNIIDLKLRNKIKRAIPAFMLLMGCLLIIRGLNLGIPYLSPHLETRSETIAPTECH